MSGIMDQTYTLSKYAGFSPLYVDFLSPMDRLSYVYLVIDKINEQNKRQKQK